MNWGKRKREVTLIIQGELTEKQFEKLYDMMYKKAFRLGLGINWSVDE